MRCWPIPLVHVGASDGGAHVGSFATYGDTGFLLSRYVRETGALSLEAAVKKITADPCDDLGPAPSGAARGGLRRRRRGVRSGRPSTAARRSPPTTSPAAARAGSGNSVGVDTVVVNGEVTWTEADGYAPKARAGVIATA